MTESKIKGLEYMTMARLNGRAVVLIGVQNNIAVVRYIGETSRFSVQASLLEEF